MVGPTSIIPGLLQAWGCEAMPDGLGPATFIQVTATLIQVTALIQVTVGGGWVKGEPHPVCHFVLITELACHRQVSTQVGRQQEHTGCQIFCRHIALGAKSLWSNLLAADLLMVRDKVVQVLFHLRAQEVCFSITPLARSSLHSLTSCVLGQQPLLVLMSCSSCLGKPQATCQKPQGRFKRP